MGRLSGALLFLFVATGCAAVPPPSSGENEFGWLEGCWQTESGGVREVWDIAGDGLLFGYGLQLKDGNPVFFEQLRIERRDNVWAYVAYPGGGSPTRFQMSECKDGSAVFTNPEHDFPQRISYTRTADGVTAQASGLDGGGAQVWVYRRCS